MGVRFLWLFLVVGGCTILSRVQANQSARRVFAHPKQPSTAQINFFSVFDKLYINSGARYSGWGGIYYCLRFFLFTGCTILFTGCMFFKIFFQVCRVYVYLMGVRFFQYQILQGVCLFDGVRLLDP